MKKSDPTCRCFHSFKEPIDSSRAMATLRLCPHVSFKRIGHLGFLKVSLHYTLWLFYGLIAVFVDSYIPNNFEKVLRQYFLILYWNFIVKKIYSGTVKQNVKTIIQTFDILWKVSDVPVGVWGIRCMTSVFLKILGTAQLWLKIIC